MKIEEIKKEIEEEEKYKLLQMSEVSLILDTYNDIFSSFDPRPYSQRSLSIDFLNEAKRATRDLPNGQIQLKLLVPYQLRSLQQETLIKRRLKEHFAKHHKLLHDDSRKLRIKGIGMAFLGVVFISIATFLASLAIQNYFIRFLEILLEPAGWFTAWTGLEDVYYTGRELSKEISFYEKVSQAEITFLSY
ncbi:hypothetical protein J4217_00715 [Candidatus Pacearchaeota archaeon]|nr:hypothetical protein [Candidatus Pacearchaeota archaeon]